MGIHVEVNTSDLQDFQLLPSDVQEKILLRIGMEYVRIVRERVAQGVDHEGGAFAPYSPAYQELKTRANRMGEGFWLWLTGHLMNSMEVEVIDDLTVKVVFQGTHPGSRFKASAKAKKGEKAPLVVQEGSGDGGGISNAFIAAVNDDTRPFVGLSDSELDDMIQWVLMEIDEHLATGA